MFNETTAAQVLYGDTANQAQGEPTPQADSTTPTGAAPISQQEPQVQAPEPKTLDQLAEGLYGDKDTQPQPFMDVPEDVKAIRESAERRLYSAQETFKQTVLDDDFKSEEYSAEDSAKVAREVREIVADLELATTDWTDLRQRAIALRVDPVAEADQVQATIQALNDRFGSQAKQALSDARLLVQRDIRVAKIIEGWGLGNDPKTVVLMAEKALSQIAAGKLKRK